MHEKLPPIPGRRIANVRIRDWERAEVRSEVGGTKACSGAISGGRIVPNKHGKLDVFEYPAGANFMMEDPSGYRFLIREDFRPPPDDTPSHKAKG